MIYQDDSFSWSKHYLARKAIRKNFPNIWKIPIVKKAQDILSQLVKEGDKVLDVGACNRNLKKDLEKCVRNFQYKSMDVDRANVHDFYSMDEVNEKFDVVVMFESIEHLTLEEGYETLLQIFRVLNDGGAVLISTPNTFHPNRYWECTHRVPFRYDELGGFLEICGLKVQKFFRVYNDDFFARTFRIYVASFLHQYLSIDFAKSILVLGRKPFSNENK